jgi:hypothetical protein
MTSTAVFCTSVAVAANLLAAAVQFGRAPYRRGAVLLAIPVSIWAALWAASSTWPLWGEYPTGSERRLAQCLLAAIGTTSAGSLVAFGVRLKGAGQVTAFLTAGAMAVGCAAVAVNLPSA